MPAGTGRSPSFSGEGAREPLFRGYGGQPDAPSAWKQETDEAPKLTYANVTATAALFLALAGGTTAVALSGHNSVKSDDIRNGEVKAADLAGSSVKGAEVKADSLKGGDLATDSVGGSEVAAAAVGSARSPMVVSLGDTDGAVGPDEIAPGAVGTSEIAAAAVGGPAVVDGSLGPAEQGAAPAARIAGTQFTPPKPERTHCRPLGKGHRRGGVRPVPDVESR